MKAELNMRELHLIRLWWLSCEDMMIPNGTCTICEFREECEVIREKLFGKRSIAANTANVCLVENTP